MIPFSCVKQMVFVMAFLSLLGCQPPNDQPGSEADSGLSGSEAFHKAPGSSANFNFVWPPRVGEQYPDLPLLNSKGQPVGLSQFRGDVLLIMPIAMNSPGSQALAGGDRLGGFNGVTPQGDIASIDQIISDFSKLAPEDPRLLVVEILIYGPDRAQAMPEHITAWATHFHRAPEQDAKTGESPGLMPQKLLARARRLTVVPSIDMRGQESFSQIPGVQLLDKDGVLRFDATGVTPRHRLRQDLMPALASFAERLSSVEGRYHIEWSKGD